MDNALMGALGIVLFIIIVAFFVNIPHYVGRHITHIFKDFIERTRKH